MKIHSKQDSIAIILANRTYLYRLLQNFFGNEPTIDRLGVLFSEHTMTSLTLLSLEHGVDELKIFAEQLNTNADAALDRVRSEYTRLFMGPTKLPAPPWESVYTTKERLLFQESTLKVRQCYLKYNFLPANYRSEPDDHLALELDFMANLSHLAQDAFQNDKPDEALNILKDQQAFLKEHLLLWVPQFVSDLHTATSHPLYLGMSSILSNFLKTDNIILDEILESN